MESYSHFLDRKQPTRTPMVKARWKALWLEERSKTPVVFGLSLCHRLPPKLGETAKVYRYR